MIPDVYVFRPLRRSHHNPEQVFGQAFSNPYWAWFLLFGVSGRVGQFLFGQRIHAQVHCQPHGVAGGETTDANDERNSAHNSNERPRWNVWIRSDNTDTHHKQQRTTGEHDVHCSCAKLETFQVALPFESARFATILSCNPSSEECAFATAMRATTEYSPRQHFWQACSTRSVGHAVNSCTNVSNTSA